MRFTAVRFRAGALPHFSSGPVAAAVDDAVAADDVFGPVGRRIEVEVRASDRLAARATVVENLLMTLLDRRVSTRGSRRPCAGPTATPRACTWTGSDPSWA
ncbi:hypothetical protein GCM10009557_02670 [Virgisporangium ochraceum]|uniref:Aldehyde dehydrogenase domain-containing protein n=1 Tax=Virgisporangium ochraceum TaxID=65505 RepID=A0A8J4EFM7_9ACTN|nr:hypothetical protein [Virgisporangium ochraceum]GIJ72808.1 hypothetical protein Voc01_077250 [Virgisporangium ochraceum]